MLVPVISKSLKVFVIVVAVLLTSDNLGVNIKSVLASLSIGGLALGLAAQDTLANIFGAVSVFIDKPFRIGDRIKLDTVDGLVENIGLRSTRIRNLDGYLVTIPNKTMGNAIITNVSRRPTIKTEINLGLTYDTTAERLRLALSIVNDIYRNHPQTASVDIVFNNFADSSLNIQVVHYCKAIPYADYLVALQEMNLALKKRFDEAGLEFAFPSRTLYLKQDKAPA
jgi:MscS family membrane protein